MTFEWFTSPYFETEAAKVKLIERTKYGEDSFFAGYILHPFPGAYCGYAIKPFSDAVAKSQTFYAIKDAKNWVEKQLKLEWRSFYETAKEEV